MLRRASRLGGTAVSGTDGPIGNVDDLLIEESGWRVGWLVVTSDAGSLALAPQHLTSAENGSLALAPGVQDPRRGSQASAADRRGSGETLLRHGPASAVERDLGFVLGKLSQGDSRSTGFLFPPQDEAGTGGAAGQAHRAREIVGSALLDEGGAIGTVEDLLIDRDDWTVRYLVIAADEALGHRRLLLSPRWISDIDWERGKITTGIAREAMAKSPAYDPETPLERNDEVRLHAHYGQWGYWR